MQQSRQPRDVAAVASEMTLPHLRIERWGQGHLCPMLTIQSFGSLREITSAARRPAEVPGKDTDMACGNPGTEATSIRNPARKHPISSRHRMLSNRTNRVEAACCKGLEMQLRPGGAQQGDIHGGRLQQGDTPAYMDTVIHAGLAKG
jgi:hypothetical protein